jgi:cardiolipin synthase A/B
MQRQSFRGFFYLVLCTLGLGGCVSPEKEISKPVHTAYSVSDPEFRNSMSHLLGAPLVDGNQVQTLINGDEIFPSMLQAIREAKQSITMEMYIWSKGEVSDEFVKALSERARAGVTVHLIVDGLGSSKLPQKSIFELKKAGVKFTKYNYPHWWRFIKRFNHRTHRKTLVVDGRIGFTGGVCIHDSWQSNAEGRPFWRDNHYRIEGPIVGQMQAVFMDNWVRMKNQVLQGEDYFPEPLAPGHLLAQFFPSGPHQGIENARLNYLMSIAASRKSIRLAHSYFVPDRLIMNALLEARKRGVRIEVIIPGPIDAGVVKAASRPKWIELMDAGVEFFEYQPTLYHCKLLIVDDLWVSAGSCNFDDRSLHINDEANFNVLDPGFAAEQIQVFEKDKAQSRSINPEDLKRRHIFTKFYDHFWGLFTFML